jgi:hypothetical protein
MYEKLTKIWTVISNASSTWDDRSQGSATGTRLR